MKMNERFCQCPNCLAFWEDDAHASLRIEVKGGIVLSPSEAKRALEEAMEIIEAVGTTGIYSRMRQASEWMKRYFPNWA